MQLARFASSCHLAVLPASPRPLSPLSPCPSPLHSCPAGWYTNAAVNATACLPCPAGTFSAYPNSISCTPCTGATYSNTTAARTCQLCPAGQVATGPTGFATGFPNGNKDASGSTQCRPWWVLKYGGIQSCWGMAHDWLPCWLGSAGSAAVPALP